MKFFLVVALTACVAISLASPLSEEFKEKIKKRKAECIAETGVSEEVVKKAKEDGVFDDPKISEFLVCFFKKPGFLNEAGELQIDVIKTKITDKHGEEHATKIIECAKKSHGNAKENAIALAKCFHEHKSHKHDH